MSTAMVGLAVGGAALVAGGVALALGHGEVAQEVTELRNAPAGTPVSQAQLARYASSREYHQAATQPPGTRPIPIVSRQRTLLVPSEPYRRSLAGQPMYLKAHATPTLAKAHLRVIREGLRAAGRSDEDARLVLLLLAVESGHFVSCWNWQVGNIKAPDTYANPRLIGQRQVWTHHPYASGVYLLVDGVNSFDDYFAFASLADFFRHQKRLFGLPRYAGVLAGYRLGGDAGLVQSATALSRGGYSGSPDAAGIARRIRDHRSIFRLYAQRCGAEWVR